MIETSNLWILLNPNELSRHHASAAADHRQAAILSTCAGRLKDLKEKGNFSYVDSRRW